MQLRCSVVSTLEKSFAKPSYIYIAETLHRIYHHCGKGCHIVYVINNTGEEFHGYKVLPMREGSKILVKISSCTVYPPAIHIL